MEQGFLDALNEVSTIDDTKELVDWIRELVADGENLNIQDSNGSTYLMLTITGYETNIEIVNALIEGGVNVNTQNRGGTTALMFAAEYTDAEIVNALIEAGADVNLENKKGETPLDTAFLIALVTTRGNHNQEIIDILIKAENKSKKRIARDAYKRSRDKPYLHSTPEIPLRGLDHEFDDADHIMQKILSMTYGEDEEENEGVEESKSNRGDAGDRRRKSVIKKSRSRRKKSNSKKMSMDIDSDESTIFNKKIYKQVVKDAKQKFKVWPSKYANNWINKEYKKRGGFYIYKKSKKQSRRTVVKKPRRLSNSRKASIKKPYMKKPSRKASIKKQSNKKPARRSNSRKLY